MLYMFDKHPQEANLLLRQYFGVLRYYKSLSGRLKPRDLINSIRCEIRNLTKGDMLEKRCKNKSRWIHSCTVFYYGDCSTWNDIIYDYRKSCYYLDEFAKAVKGEIPFFDIHNKSHFFRLEDGSFYDKDKYFEYKEKAYPRSRYQLDDFGNLLDMNKEVILNYYNCYQKEERTKLSLEDDTQFIDKKEDVARILGKDQLHIFNEEVPSVLPRWFFMSMLVFNKKYRFRHRLSIPLSFKSFNTMEFRPCKGHLDVFKAVMEKNKELVPGEPTENWRNRLSSDLSRYLNWSINLDYGYGKANKISKRILKTLFKNDFLKRISTEDFLKAMKMIKEIIAMENGGENL